METLLANLNAFNVGSDWHSMSGCVIISYNEFSRDCRSRNSD